MAGKDRHRCCAGCGERIGVYEPIWIQGEDDTLTSTSLLNIDEQDWAGEQGPRLFHLGCLAPDEIPQTRAV